MNWICWTGWKKSNVEKICNAKENKRYGKHDLEKQIRILRHKEKTSHTNCYANSGFTYRICEYSNSCYKIWCKLQTFFRGET